MRFEGKKDRVQIVIFWVVASFSFVGIYRRLGGAYELHL